MTDFTDVGASFDDVWQKETEDLSVVPTARAENDRLNENILQNRDYILEKGKEFNKTVNSLKLRPFQWCQRSKDDAAIDNPNDEQILESQWALFGFRLGSEAADPAFKFSVICHMDTVPADAESPLWDPYVPVVKPTEYPTGAAGDQDFLVGRGCLDDKGPAVSAFIAARCLARAYDGTAMLDDMQVEVVFDTSEETNMSTPMYFEAKKTNPPDFGIVYDASWITRAEKGGERPVFTVTGTPMPTDGLYVESLITSTDNSTNTIPDWAEAVIRGDSSQLTAYFNTVSDDYDACEWDNDPNDESTKYNPAVMTPTMAADNSSVTLRAVVAGAQHGSAPDLNRAEGANPLISLANFLAIQSAGGSFTTPTATTAMCEFVRSTWGTHVFGEGTTDLEASDEVFRPGNGTTYAITKTTMDDAFGIQLELDIRYALGHQSGPPWDGHTEGFLNAEQDSLFGGIFSTIVSDFNAANSQYADVVLNKTETLFQPDIRVPETNPYFKTVASAYKTVMGVEPAYWAAGGGTDAKGYTFMVAAGALFNLNLGPPINFHGINEGAPMADLRFSTQILYQVMVNEVEDRSVTVTERKKAKISMAQVKKVFRKHKKQCMC